MENNTLDWRGSTFTLLVNGQTNFLIEFSDGKERMPIEAVEPRRLYRQVADQLRQLIASGEYAVGGRLPTERELVDQICISRSTVREALIALEVGGRIRIRVDSGHFVTGSPPTRSKPTKALSNCCRRGSLSRVRSPRKRRSTSGRRI